jgi:BirA family biotin operon repressor/biotin-[acetyl-CoA-carboxylase] ligase
MTEPTAPLITWLDECASTNSELAKLVDAPHGTVIAVRNQTSGRGQRTHTWESQPGCNLTFSLLLRPSNISASEQFTLSKRVSLAIVDVLDQYVEGVSIKWPNDIYVGDRKICGILIENTLSGYSIERSIVGIGLNVNQMQFVSDAPNPVSLVQLIGKELPLHPLLEELSAHIIEMVDTDDDLTDSTYFTRLWHNTGYHPYRDAATLREFEAKISNVDERGILTLIDRDGNSLSYAFNEVVQHIPQSPR